MPVGGETPGGAAARVAAVIPLIPAWRVDRAFDYRVPDKLAHAVTAGVLVRVPFGGRKVRGFVAAVTEASDPGELQEIAGVVVPIPLVPPRMFQLYSWIARRYAVPTGAALARAVPPRVRVEMHPVDQPPSRPGSRPSVVTGLEGGADLLGAISEGRPGTWCVRSLTPLHHGAIAAELAGAVRSGAALVVTPEVRFGSPVLDELARTFPELARLDSARGDPERSASWVRLAAGHWLGGGGRAAVLGPAADLRLIVVEDEANASLKEDRSPRYDARRVAVERARLQGAVCVLLASSPSVETGAAARTGWGYAKPSRADERGVRPLVELTAPPREGGISRRVHAAIKKTLDEGEAVALLVPRRGYARALWCAACRRTVRCPVCESGVSYQLDARSLRCGRCGYSGTAPDVCPTCGANDFRYLGAGSERLAEQLAKAFPRVVVTHADPDSTEPRVRAVTETPSIYVTTYFGTKPVLRPPASFVAVLDVDGLLRRPGFRAAEEGYQVLSQMAAWAGPASEGGRLLVETLEPSHHALQALTRADYEYFLDRELQLRAELRYPPFTQLIRASATGPAARAVLERVAASARTMGATVVGPVTLASWEARGSQEVLLKCADAGVVGEGLGVILRDVPKGTTLRIDVDPR